MSSPIAIPIAIPIDPPQLFQNNRYKYDLSETDYLLFSIDKYFRISQVGLRQLARSLSERDRLIILTIYEYKLMSSEQLKKLFFSNTTQRSCSRVLSRLVRDNLLLRSDRRIGGLFGGSDSYVFALGPIGARLVGKPLQNYKKLCTSHLFLEHSLAIAEIYVSIKELAINDYIRIIDLQTEPNCWRTFSNYGKLETLKPDMFVRLVNPKSLKEYFWFIELDRGTAHKYKIQSKAKIYEQYFWSGARFENNLFPGVIWVAPDNYRKNNLIKFLEPSNKAIPTLHQVVTSDIAPYFIGNINVVE